ncbi:MAG TPA: hypothetical protein VIB48_01080 [Acidimicrobiia bacterium]|jgi:hypothetical protein
MAERLDLVREELRDLAREILSHDGDASQPYCVYAFRSDAPGARLARWLEGEIFGRFFGNTPEMLDAEYSPFNDATVFLCVIDRRRSVPAGMMRLILPSAQGLKTLQDLPHFATTPVDVAIAESGIDLGDTWDVTTIAVDDEYRRTSGGLVSIALYQCLGLATRRFDTRGLVAVMDLIALDLVQQVTHDVFDRFPGTEPARYLDSPASLPVYSDLHRYWPRLRSEDATAFALFAEGHGMEEVLHQPTPEGLDEAFAPARLLSH